MSFKNLCYQWKCNLPFFSTFSHFQTTGKSDFFVFYFPPWEFPFFEQKFPECTHFGSICLSFANDKSAAKIVECKIMEEESMETADDNTSHMKLWLRYFS
jgi:hypothetical protein